MDFNEREKKLNTLFNMYINYKKDEQWSIQEQKRLQMRINNLDAELFFLQIDRYVEYLNYDILNAELEHEYLQVNQ